MFVKFKSSQNKVFEVKADRVLQALRLACPSSFPKGKKFAEREILEYAKILSQRDIDDLEIYSETPTEWEYAKNGKIKNISKGNQLAVSRELEKRGVKYTYATLDDARKYLSKLEDERISQLEKKSKEKEEPYLRPILLSVNETDFAPGAGTSSTPSGDRSECPLKGWQNFTHEQEKLIHLEDSVIQGVHSASSLSGTLTQGDLDKFFGKNNSIHLYENVYEDIKMTHEGRN